MKHRTTLVTVASVAGVFLAGAAAIGANIGILGRNDDEFGQLSVTAAPVVATTADASAVDRADLNGSSPSTTFQVDGVATLVLAIEGARASIVSVAPQPGWTWQEQAGDPWQARLRFQRGNEELDTVARVDDGDIELRTATPTGGTVASTGDADRSRSWGETQPDDDGSLEQVNGSQHDEPEHEYGGWDDDD